MSVKDYKELEVYRLAFDAAMEIFEISKAFPQEERYSLTDQIRRSARSVCANIAEAWRKRRYEAAFVSKLSDADTEAAETEVWLDFALKCGYIQEAVHKKLRDKYDHICRQLYTMMKDAPSWCRSSSVSHASAAALRSTLAAPRSPLNAQRASGIALVMVLGVLSVMVIMAVAFAISMRTERVAAGNYADSVRARQLVHVGLARALDDLAGKLGTNGLMSAAGGTNYPPWDVTNSYTTNYVNPAVNVYLVYATNNSTRENEATNFVPRALWTAATNADYQNASNHWVPVDSIVANGGGAESNRMGRVKYLILNCSGLLDANFAGGAARGIGTNPCELAISNMPEFFNANAQQFINNRTRDCRYETLEELDVLNQSPQAFKDCSSNFAVYSYAPPGYWDANTRLVSNQVNLAGDANQLVLRMAAISNAFVQAGFNANQAGILFNNLIDYVDNDFVPSSYVYGVEPVPMISRIVFNSVVNGPDYDVTVTFRLWYPFVDGGGKTFEFNAEVEVGASSFVILDPNVQVPNKGLSGLLSQTITMAAGTYAPKIIFATVKDGGAVVDMLKPNAVLPAYTPGSSMSWECIDPRFNYDPSDGATWAQLGAMFEVDPVNGVTTNYWGSNPDVDHDSDMYVTNRALKSVGELGYLSYDPSLPWRTVKLYGANCHRVLDCFAIGTNDTDTYVANTIWRGRVNPNTRETEVLSVVFSNMPMDEYPGQSASTLTPVELQAVVANIRANAFSTNLSDVGRNFTTAQFPASANNELKREALFRNTCGLLSVRQNLFTIIIEAHVASGGNIPRSPIRQRAVALVWRDPYTGEMFVRSIKWLKD